ncbi:MAG: class I SAM-dependent methyltransferase [Methanothrix sp.]|nr:class I SAM-dependent methyltransferase [Methanothrix sp.]
MNETKSTIKSYWDRRSSTFDMSPGHTLSSKREEDAWKSLFLDKIGPGEKRVLDVGAGTGFLSIMLAEIGYSVVGVDLSEEMIKNARKKMDARGLKVRLEVGDAEDLPFEDGSFDAVVNRAVLWTLPNPKRALIEWKRVLKPGGILCFFLHGPHSNGLSHRLTKQLTNLVILARERRNPWKSLYDSVDLPMGGGIESSVVIDLLKKVGYTEIRSDPLIEIGEMKSENMPWYYRISSQKSTQYCYYCRKS